MEFGIQHGMGDPNWAPEIIRPAAVRAFAARAEEVGFHHLAFTDHPAPSTSWVNAGGEGVADLFTSLGFCAGVTERIGLLSWMMVVPYHNPFMAAHRIATLDALSDGRLTLGIGTGYLKSEFFAVGADFAERCAAFDRNIDTIRDALTGESVSAEGPGYSARNVQVMPPAVQRPHPPLWVHGNSRFGLERAARWGQGWVGLFSRGANIDTIRTRPLPDMDTFRRRVDELRTAVEAAGRDVAEVAIIASGVVPIVDVRAGWSRDEYLERFADLEDAGCTVVVANAIGDDAAASEESIVAFAEDFIS